MSVSREIEARLRETAGKLLSEKKVSLFLGFEKASLPFRTTPLFLSKAEEAERLAWNPFCTANLSVYLPRLFKAPADAREAKAAPRPPTVGVALKGCDIRSVVALLQEKQVRRENLVLVQIACSGMADWRKAEKALAEHEALGAGEDERGDIRVVVEDGTEIMLRREDVMADACRECRSPGASIHDIMIGTPVEGKKTDTARQRVAEHESKPLDVRWALFQEAFSKCIRCNACRQACPMCYCKTCLFDQNRPRWIGAGTDSSDIALYHLVRAFHMAGRCTECGACERACPMGIDVRLLGRKLCAEVEDLYGYRPGEAIDAIPVLSSFTMDDPQDFLTEP
jgi:formate dehydrogenase subunit beta